MGHIPVSRAWRCCSLRSSASCRLTTSILVAGVLDTCCVQSWPSCVHDLGGRSVARMSSVLGIGAFLSMRVGTGLVGFALCPSTSTGVSYLTRLSRPGAAAAISSRRASTVRSMKSVCVNTHCQHACFGFRGTLCGKDSLLDRLQRAFITPQRGKSGNRLLRTRRVVDAKIDYIRQQWWPPLDVSGGCSASKGH
jgi:hypothetical protein